jgi:hypothetical protein
MHWPKPHRNGDFGYNIGVSTYPDNWKDLAKACKQRAGWRCEECGATEHLGAAHVNHDPENPTPELRCLCWSCHRAYDARTGANHPGKKARRLATRKKNREKKNKQLTVKPGRSLDTMRSNIRFENEFSRQYMGFVKRNSGYGPRAYSRRTAYKVRIEYLYTLWHISCMRTLHRNLYTQTVWTRNYMRI